MQNGHDHSVSQLYSQPVTQSVSYADSQLRSQLVMQTVSYAVSRLRSPSVTRNQPTQIYETWERNCLSFTPLPSKQQHIKHTQKSKHKLRKFCNNDVNLTPKKYFMKQMKTCRQDFWMIKMLQNRLKEWFFFSTSYLTKSFLFHLLIVSRQRRKNNIAVHISGVFTCTYI